MHNFFGPIQALWDEIVALKHPPCPDPPISRVDNDVSLDFNSVYETQYGEEEFDNDNGINVLQPMHGDDYTSSAHNFDHDGLPDEEHVRSRRRADESDATSLIQAMPSSASIWFNPGVDPALPGTFTSDVNSSTLHISTDAFNMVQVSDTMDMFFTADWTSTPQPRLCDTLGRTAAEWPRRQCPSQLNELGSCCPVALPADVALPEKITMSLLEAMETRDRQETTVRIEKRRRTTRRLIIGSRKLIKATVRWTWKKLHFR
jgi:hypothetical protein